MTKKNILLTSVALIIGFMVGWLIFSGSSEEIKSVENPSEAITNHDHDAVGKNQMWTCSMHPQIMQPEPGDCPICGMDLIPAESGADGLAPNEIKMSKNAVALANIETTIVGSYSKNGENTISLSGKIKPNENKTFTQSAHFNGRIEKLYVKTLGETLRKGQAIAVVYSPELVAAQQELITATKLKESQPKLFEAVKNKFKIWRIPSDEVNQVIKLGTVKTSLTIYSHIDGVVTALNVSEGGHITDGMAILQTANLASVWAEFDAYENQISEFSKGQKIKVISSAYPDKEFDANISFIDPVLNTQTRTVTVRAILNNNNGLLKPGMFVTGKTEAKDANGGSQLIIPASSVMWTGERSLVYVKTNPNEPVFEMREVVLGNRYQDGYIILSGVTNGEEIVNNGTFTVDAAAQLQGKKSMMNQSKNVSAISETKIELSAEAGKKFRKSIKPYLQMKDAFVSEKIEDIQTFAQLTLEQINAIPKSEMEKMQSIHLTEIKKALTAILGTTDIENQREQFVVLNQNMVPLIKNLHNVNQKLYIQKCPMAHNNHGAVWISSTKEILNPYYGESMLTCGSVIDSVY
ncbi:efflux RND transporter periplasmic adaptor subunit [Galbibacter mesophilus]|nr:efflux RND transporter periplasmic adaptor subunit [Galbibacter mesophilus]